MGRIAGRIVEWFSLEEMMNQLSEEDIVLEITPEVREHAEMMNSLRIWAVFIFPVIFRLGLIVSSWYRTVAFNASIGGASNSAHLDGRATDINNIDTTNEILVQAFIVAWQVICSIHHKIGGVEVYDWGMHFDSFSDKFGYTEFRTKDNR